MSETLPELSSRQKTAVRVIIIAALALCGVALLLTGLGVFPCGLNLIWLPSVLFTLSFCFFAAGFIGKNPVSVWFGAAFLPPAVIGVLAGYTNLGYGQLYPLYIAAPAFASLITGLFWLKFKPHIRAIVFFGALAGLFSLQSSGLLGFIVVIPLVIVFVGLCAAYVAIMIRKYKNE